MSVKLYAVCPKEIDVFFTGFHAESLAELRLVRMVVECPCCRDPHNFFANSLICVEVPPQQNEQNSSHPKRRRLDPGKKNVAEKPKETSLT